MVAIVIETINTVLVDKGLPPVTGLGVSSDIFAVSGLDSLSIAEVVVRLEQKTGQFPFAGGFVRFTTVGELAKLYT
jgi:acyl carrier protein